MTPVKFDHDFSTI